MPTLQLIGRALVTVSGEEAEHFLQNLITTDLASLEAEEVRAGALLSPQGKILFDFLVSRSGTGSLAIDCRADIADELVRRLTFYRLRAKLEISSTSQALVLVRWGTDSPVSTSESSPSRADSTTSPGESRWLRDTRFRVADVFRRYGEPRTGNASVAEWHRLRIENAVPESGSDYALGEAFPHDVLLDELGGVGLRKGCYVGQEVVSRMQHRGTARRRVLLASSVGGALPGPGTEITAAGRPLGALGSTAGDRGMAIVRIDRVKAALSEGLRILAGDMPVHLAIPPFAKFTFPADDGIET